MTADQYYPQAVLIWLDTPQSSLLAQRSLRLWHAINEELSPLVGASGFITLYGRCLDLCGASFPWLEKAPAGSPPALCFDTLAAQLAARAPPNALAASRTVFSTFYELLRLLIGASLADGVLDAAWRDRVQNQPLLFVLKSVPPTPQ
jgi:hypothetical protein